MFLYKNKGFYNFFILIITFVIFSNNIIYAAQVVETDVSNYYLYSPKEYLDRYESKLEEAIALAPKLELTPEEEMALQKARSKGLVYASYPGILSLGDESPNIEQFNLEFIKGVLDIDIQFKTTQDFGVKNNFESVEILLDSGIVNLAGFYNYSNTINENRQSQHYSTKPFSKQNLYQVSHINKSSEEVDFYNDKVAISENVMQVNQLDVLTNNTIVTDDIKVGIDLVKQKLVDYYIVEAEVLEHIVIEGSLVYTPIKDSRLTPNLSLIATDPDYETIINIINRLYTGSVLEVFYYVTEDTLSRNRYVIFEETYKTNQVGFVSYDQEVSVAFYESKGIIEKNTNGEWQGFAVDYLEEISYITGLSFNYIDYTNKTVESMIADLSTGKIDVVLCLPYELKDKYQKYVGSNDINLVFSKPYFEKKLNVLKYREASQLNSLEDLAIAKVGYDVHNKEIVQDFLNKIFGGLSIDNMYEYQNSDLLFDALLNQDINYSIGLPGEKVNLIRNEKALADYAFDYESDVDINSYKFSFVFADVNNRFSELLGLINGGINTIHLREYNVWFMENVSFQEIIEMSNFNTVLKYGILAITLIAVAIAVTVYFRTNKANKKMLQLIKVDKISGLGNRYAFFDDISIEEKNYYCVIISVDNTKGFFESIGKWNITPMLRAIGNRITNISTDIEFKTYRLTGEEFVMIVQRVDEGQFEKFMALLLASLKMPYQLMDMTLNINFNIGVCESSYAGKDTKKMLLYAKNMVKEHSINKEINYAIFDDRDKSEVDEIEKIEYYMNNDLNKCISPYYQPIIDVETGKILGVEVLARLTASSTVFTADKFIEIAKRNDKLADIDQLIIEKTIENREFLLERKYIDEDFYFSINISFDYIKRFSKSQLVNLKYMNNVINLSFLQVEVTEEYLSTPETERFFNLLESERVKLAVDDFSIGHSSLAKIVERKIDVIKIDKNLLLSGLDETNKQLYISLVDMLRNMNQKVISNGVQSKNHHLFIKKVNINAKQGYFYSKPLSITDLIRELTN